MTGIRPAKHCCAKSASTACDRGDSHPRGEHAGCCLAPIPQAPASSSPAKLTAVTGCAILDEGVMDTTQQFRPPVAIGRYQVRSCFGIRDVYYILLRATRATIYSLLTTMFAWLIVVTHPVWLMSHSLSYESCTAYTRLCPTACCSNLIPSTNFSRAASELESCAVEHVGNHIAFEVFDARVSGIFVRPEA